MAKQRAHVDRARLAAALATFMTERSLTQADLAERLETSQPTVSDWIAQRATPSPASLRRILAALGIDQSAVAPLPEGQVDAASIPNVVMIRRGGQVGAGKMPVALDVPDADPYPAAEFRRLLGFDPSGLVWAVVVGDSNLPLLRPGDRVIYLPTNVIADHGLYVILVDDVQLVKSVQRLGGGALAVVSENPKYRVETYTPVDDPDGHLYRSDLSSLTAAISVVGKVVWYPTLA